MGNSESAQLFTEWIAPLRALWRVPVLELLEQPSDAEALRVLRTKVLARSAHCLREIDNTKDVDESGPTADNSRM